MISMKETLIRAMTAWVQPYEIPPAAIEQVSEKLVSYLEHRMELARLAVIEDFKTLPRAQLEEKYSFTRRIGRSPLEEAPMELDMETIEHRLELAKSEIVGGLGRIESILQRVP